MSGSPDEARGFDRRFVVQKHDASTLHYDVRLEVGDVLVSWAVPKGPSTDPREKRLAIRVDDHEMEALTFEGVVPEGAYGAGTVLVWDAGSYRDLRADEDGTGMEEALDEGLLEVWLEGEKLRGGWALKRTDDERWLLIKMDDEAADARRNPTSTEPLSVRTGRSLDEVREQERRPPEET